MDANSIQPPTKTSFALECLDIQVGQAVYSIDKFGITAWSDDLSKKLSIHRFKAPLQPVYFSLASGGQDELIVVERKGSILHLHTIVFSSNVFGQAQVFTIESLESPLAYGYFEQTLFIACNLN